MAKQQLYSVLVRFGRRTHEICVKASSAKHAMTKANRESGGNAVPRSAIRDSSCRLK